MEAARLILGVLLAAVGVTAAASLGGWWMAPSRAAARAVRRRLGVRPDALATAPEQSRAAGVDARGGTLALVRFPGDPGVPMPLAALRGAELMLDGEVSARVFRGEGRRALDRIDPKEGGRVTLRLAFVDPADPAFEMDLWRPGDRPRPGRDAAAALDEARRLFSALEAALLRG